MSGDAMCAGRFTGDGRLRRAWFAGGLAAIPRLPQGRHMVNIYTQLEHRRTLRKNTQLAKYI
jgi:hypothetical protein